MLRHFVFILMPIHPSQRGARGGSEDTWAVITPPRLRGGRAVPDPSERRCRPLLARRLRGVCVCVCVREKDIERGRGLRERVSE